MIERAIEGLMSILEKVLGLSLLFAILLNFANVVTRYGFGYSILWADEVEMLILVLVTFIGAAVVSWRRQHLSMDMIVDNLPPALKAGVRLLELAVLIAVAALVGTQSYVYASQMLMLGRVSDNASIPMWIPHSSVAIGFALVVFVAIWQTVSSLRSSAAGSPETASELSPNDREGAER